MEIGVGQKNIIKDRVMPFLVKLTKSILLTNFNIFLTTSRVDDWWLTVKAFILTLSLISNRFDEDWKLKREKECDA